MKFVSSRELRIHPGTVWKTLKREKDRVITSNGKPIAVLTFAREDNLEVVLGALRQGRAHAAAGAICRAAVDRGLDRRTDKRLARSSGKYARLAVKQPLEGGIEGCGGHRRACLRPASSRKHTARILDLVLSRHVSAALEHRVYNEYQEVLPRPEFGFPRLAVIDLLDFLWLSSERVHVTAMAIDLRDPDDVKFLEVAINAAADALVTGNLRPFPLHQRHGVQVLSPRQLWGK